MHGELPVCKRCCLCLPLRYGLITWGYLKLIVGCCVIPEMSYVLYLTIEMIRMAPENNRLRLIYSDLIPVCLALIFYVTDFVMTSVFIVGGHKKNVKLLREFYFYGIAVLVLILLVGGVSIGVSIESQIRATLPLKYILLDLSAYCASIVVQAYFLMLLRSEIIKLENNCEFRFVNNATEAEYTMKCDEDIADGETEDV